MTSEDGTVRQCSLIELFECAGAVVSTSTVACLDQVPQKIARRYEINEMALNMSKSHADSHTLDMFCSRLLLASSLLSHFAEPVNKRLLGAHRESFLVRHGVHVVSKVASLIVGFAFLPRAPSQ